MHIFSNVEDPYLSSLKLTSEEEYQDFFYDSNIMLQFDEEKKKKKMKKYSRQIDSYLENLFNLELYGYNDSEIYNKMNKLFEKFFKSFEILEDRKKTLYIQKLLLKKSIFIKFLKFLKIFKEYEIPEEIIENILKLGRIFLAKNNTNHCIFIQEYYFNTLDDVMDEYPDLVSDFYIDVFENYNKILIKNDEVFHFLLGKIFIKYADIKNFNIMVKIFKIVSFYLKIDDIPKDKYMLEYDLLFAPKIKEFFKYFNLENFEDKLKNPEKRDREFDFYVIYLTLIRSSIKLRFENLTFRTLTKYFPLKNLENYLTLCDNEADYPLRYIFIKMIKILYIDPKDCLINDRWSYYETKPADMQYDEDIYYDTKYGIVFGILERELGYSLEKIEYYQNENGSEKFLKYFNEGLIDAICKLTTFFLTFRDNELYLLKKYEKELRSLDEFFVNNLNEFQKLLFGKKEKIRCLEREESKKFIDVEMGIKYEKKIEIAKIREHFKSISMCCKKLIIGQNIDELKKRYIDRKNIVGTVEKIKKHLKRFSSKLSDRKEVVDLPLKKLEKRAKKSNKSINSLDKLIAHYQINKSIKLGIEAKKNVYINSLINPAEETQILSFNLCGFIHHQFKNAEWSPRNKVYFLEFIENLCNCLFIATEPCQKYFYYFVKNDMEVLDKIWGDMKYTINFVRYKTTIDRVWKENFRKSLIYLKFHQFLCEDNNNDFKTLFRVKILPLDKVERLRRLITMFQKMCDKCQWATNYEPNTLETFKPFNKSYLIPIGIYIFDCLQELTTGPCLQNQKKIYEYIYNRYNGILSRYNHNANSELYRIKVLFFNNNNNNNVFIFFILFNDSN